MKWKFIHERERESVCVCVRACVRAHWVLRNSPPTLQSGTLLQATLHPTPTTIPALRSIQNNNNKSENEAEDELQRRRKNKEKKRKKRILTGNSGFAKQRTVLIVIGRDDYRIAEAGSGSQEGK